MGAGYYGKRAMARDKMDDSAMFYNRCTTKYKFAWLPERCCITDKRIWLKCGYELTAIWTGPGEPIIEHKWHDKYAHLVWKLTGY